MMTKKAEAEAEAAANNNIYDTSPEFRIIFFPAHSSHHLKLPPKFDKKLKVVLPSECLLESRGKEWCVTLKEVSDNLLQFENGWMKFVKDNALAYGDFLVFSYTGDLKFHVSIWDKNGCRKTLQRSEACQTQTTLCDPFQVTLRPAYWSYMNIPKEFLPILKKHKNCTLRMAQESWVVNLTGSDNDRPRFGQGLAKFYRDNNVKIGDLLTFQFIPEDDIVFSVTVSRHS